MKPYIRIVRRPYEEPYHVNLIVAASNGRTRGELEIYANAADLETLGTALLGFPKRQDDEAKWELGSEKPDDRFAFYCRLRVRQVASNGRCAVELRLNNNAAPPDREIAEFSISALPADLDRLASLLTHFGKLEHRVLEWNVTDGGLRQDA
jgi:hypothetical protein